MYASHAIGHSRHLHCRITQSTLQKLFVNFCQRLFVRVLAKATERRARTQNAAAIEELTDREELFENSEYPTPDSAVPFWLVRRTDRFNRSNGFNMKQEHEVTHQTISRQDASPKQETAFAKVRTVGALGDNAIYQIKTKYIVYIRKASDRHT
jgi:hypothetical protein